MRSAAAMTGQRPSRALPRIRPDRDECLPLGLERGLVMILYVIPVLVLATLAVIAAAVKILRE
jgi:hypothetical protein